MKKLCAVLLSLCIMLSCCCAEQLLPDYSLLLPSEMPSIRHFTDGESRIKGRSSRAWYNAALRDNKDAGRFCDS